MVGLKTMSHNLMSTTKLKILKVGHSFGMFPLTVHGVQKEY
jgi:hypothetical protein